MKNEFITKLKALCEEYGLCVVPEENDKYELPLVIAQYEGENKSLYDYLDNSHEDGSNHTIDDEISDEMLESCREHGIGVTAVDMVWDEKKQDFVEVRNERLV